MMLRTILLFSIGAFLLGGCAGSGGLDPAYDYKTVTIRVEVNHPVLLSPVEDLETQGWMVYKVSQTQPAYYGTYNRPYAFRDNDFWYQYYLLRRPKAAAPPQ